ncbi:hypothetical protein H4R99_008730, partial [Coemansia sp. RSA 1722]
AAHSLCAHVHPRKARLLAVPAPDAEPEPRLGRRTCGAPWLCAAPALAWARLERRGWLAFWLGVEGKGQSDSTCFGRRLRASPTICDASGLGWSAMARSQCTIVVRRNWPRNWPL